MPGADNDSMVTVQRSRQSEGYNTGNSDHYWGKLYSMCFWNILNEDKTRLVGQVLMAVGQWTLVSPSQSR